jgi:hypothetical protein
VGEARGERGGLAGTGAGEDEDRPVGGQHGLTLGSVEAGKVRGVGGQRSGLGHE